MSYQHFLWELHFILFQGPADKSLSFKDDLMMRRSIYIFLLSMISPPNTRNTDMCIVFKLQCWSAVAVQWHMHVVCSCLALRTPADHIEKWNRGDDSVDGTFASSLACERPSVLVISLSQKVHMNLRGCLSICISTQDLVLLVDQHGIYVSFS